jgi:hypothetical protein
LKAYSILLLKEVDMKTSILIIITLTITVSGCSTTTYFNLKQTYPEHIENELKKVKRDTNVGVEVSLLLKNADEVHGELLFETVQLSYAQNIQLQKKN